MTILQRPRRDLILALLLLAPLLALGPRSSHAGEAEDRLRLLADEAHEGHDDALAWWGALKPHAQVALLRRTLAAKDVPLATTAAEALGAEYLDHGELRRQMQLLQARPLSALKCAPALHDWGLGEGLRAWGAADLVPFFRGAVADTSGELEDIALDSWHRVMHPRHVEGLVPLLDKGGPKVFQSVLWHVAMCGEYDREDRYRAQVARGLLYGLQRMRAQRAEKPVPALSKELPEVTSAAGRGLPEAYLTLAEAYYPREGNWNVRLDAEGPPGDLKLRSTYFWLRRWAQGLTPAAKDLPYEIPSPVFLFDIRDQQPQRVPNIEQLFRAPFPRPENGLSGLSGRTNTRPSLSVRPWVAATGSSQRCSAVVTRHASWSSQGRAAPYQAVQLKALTAQ